MVRQIVIRKKHATSILIIIMQNTRENNIHLMTADHKHGCIQFPPLASQPTTDLFMLPKEFMEGVYGGLHPFLML